MSEKELHMAERDFLARYILVVLLHACQFIMQLRCIVLGHERNVSNCVYIEGQIDKYKKMIKV